MKKSLVALAALAATTAFAQSSVTVYGIVDQAYQTNNQTSRDGTKYAKYRGVGEGAMAGSRIGFRGEEDLGGGMKANFVLEQGIYVSQGDGFNMRKGGDAMDTPFSGGKGSNRQAYVGLSDAKLGTVRLGRQYAATYDMYTNNGFIVAEAAGNGQATFDAGGNRVKAVTYLSPMINNIQLGLQRGGVGDDGENIDTTENQANGFKDRKALYTSYRAMWSNGPAKLGYTYEKADFSGVAASGTAATNFYGVSATNGTTTTAPYSVKTSTAVGSYNFGPAELIGIYGKKNSGAATSAVVSNETLKQISVKVPVTAKTQVMFNTFTRIADPDNGGARTLDRSGQHINVNYSFSKRTRAYVAYGKEKDDAAAANAIQDLKRTFVGVIHTF